MRDKEKLLSSLTILLMSLTIIKLSKQLKSIENKMNNRPFLDGASMISGKLHRGKMYDKPYFNGAPMYGMMDPVYRDKTMLYDQILRDGNSTVNIQKDNLDWLIKELAVKDKLIEHLRSEKNKDAGY